MRCGSAALLLVMEAVMSPAACAAAAPAAYSPESSQTEDRSKEIKNLRKQLMQDNSDYSHELPKTTGAEPLHMRADSRLDTIRGILTRNRSYRVTEMLSTDQVPKDHGDKPSQPISERDLLYSVDDERLVSRPPDRPRYGTLKVRRGFRRGGQSQFIQELGAEGVSIVSLRRAPFPELRLPRARRQYQRDHGELEEEEEEAPPPVPPEELEELQAMAGERRTEPVVSSTEGEETRSQFATPV